MNLKNDITTRLSQEMEILHLEVIDESYMHNVPEGSQSHFKIIIVADRFQNESLVARHQIIYKILDTELKEKIHALGLHCYTFEEWKKKGNAPMSPPCLGGSKP